MDIPSFPEIPMEIESSAEHPACCMGSFLCTPMDVEVQEVERHGKDP